MANWNDIKKNNTAGFYDDYEFIDISELVDRIFDVMEVTEFDNDKGMGVAAIISIDGEERKMVTHSIGVTKTLTCPEFLEALQNDVVTVCLKQGKSKKSGKYFYYIG